MINPFKNIDEINKNKLLKNLKNLTYSFDKNVDILKNIKINNCIGVVVSGKIEINKIDYNGNKTIVEELIENSIFSSKILFISDSEYEMITKEKTKIIVIDYLNILNDTNNSIYFNQFIKNLLEISIEIINTKNERIEILTKKSIRNKLLEYLNIEANKHGSKNIYLPFSFTNLADFLSIDRCAMTRELKHLKEEGFISIKNKKITLLYR